MPLDNQIRNFAKQCKNAEHARLFKSLSSKLNAHAKYMSNFIAASDVDLNNDYSLAVLKATFKSDDTPLYRFYKSWQDIWKMQENAVAQAISTSSSKTSAGRNGNAKEEKDVKNMPNSRKSVTIKDRAKVIEFDDEKSIGKKEKSVKKKRKSSKKKFENLENGPAAYAEDELRDLVLSDLEEDLS